MAFLDRAKEISVSPPVGAPHSIPVPNSERPGRSAVYRHWRCQDGLLQTLDPNVGQNTEKYVKTVEYIIEDVFRLLRDTTCSKMRVGAARLKLYRYAKSFPANRNPTSKCLGYRPYDPVKKDYGPYKWMNYGTVSKRRANFGVGIVEVNKRAGVEQQKYGIGLWCQNRPEWQLTGTPYSSMREYND